MIRSVAGRFCTHNVLCEDGTHTMSPDERTLDQESTFLQARRYLDLVFPNTTSRGRLRIADLGCLEGGFSLEIAKLGFEVWGFEVREANYHLCLDMQRRNPHSHLKFIKDDVRNLEAYGRFDAIFCSGILYHLDHPGSFLELLGRVCSRLLMLQTHFAFGDEFAGPSKSRFNLSDLDIHEGMQGRWFTEFAPDTPESVQEVHIWSGWQNHQSFWIRREDLLQKLLSVGFDSVAEQFEAFRGERSSTLLNGEYLSSARNMFVAIKDVPNRS